MCARTTRSRTRRSSVIARPPHARNAITISNRQQRVSRFLMLQAEVRSEKNDYVENLDFFLERNLFLDTYKSRICEAYNKTNHVLRR